MWKFVVRLCGATLFALSAASAEPVSHHITVVGTGEAIGSPNVARLTAGVVTQAKTAGEALAENSRNVQNVFAALKALNVPERNIQTTAFYLNPQYPPFNTTSPQPHAIIGYSVTNTVMVTIDDVSQVGKVLDALVAAGANSTSGVVFSIRDAKELMAKARTAAVHDATMRAQDYARAAGVILGNVTDIQEGASGPNLRGPMFDAVTVQAYAPAAVPPTASGEQHIRVSVTMTWEIK